MNGKTLPAGVGGASEHAPGDGTFSVTLSSYAMGTTEVTNAQYAAFLSDHGNKCGPTDCVDASSGSLELKESGGRWRPVAGFEDHPVVEVTWYGADAFAKWAGLALPTEAQWEAACRAGEQQTWSGTDTETRLSDYANLLGDSDGSSGFAPVGSLQSNGWGLYDLSGNAWEWTADWKADYPAGPVTDPTGAASGDVRVIRGGGFRYSANRARCGNRSWIQPVRHRGLMGFRVVLTPAPQR